MKWIIYLALPILIVFTVMSSTTIFVDGNTAFNPEDNYRFSEGFVNAFNDLADQAQLTNGFKVTLDTARSGVEDIKEFINSVLSGDINFTTTLKIFRALFKFIILPFTLFLEPLFVVIRISVWITTFISGLYVLPY